MKISNKIIKCECGQWLAIEEAIDPIIFAFNMLIINVNIESHKYVKVKKS